MDTVKGSDRNTANRGGTPPCTSVGTKFVTSPNTYTTTATLTQITTHDSNTEGLLKVTGGEPLSASACQGSEPCGVRAAVWLPTSPARDTDPPQSLRALLEAGVTSPPSAPLADDGPSIVPSCARVRSTVTQHVTEGTKRRALGRNKWLTAQTPPSPRTDIQQGTYSHQQRAA